MNPKKPRPSIDVWVSDHARERMRERFGMKGARVVDEVREALLAGRVSRHNPDGRNSLQGGCYCWNSERAYALKMADNGFVVTTVVSREAA